jgi:hypothetical protein
MSYINTVGNNNTSPFGDGSDGDFTLVGDYTQTTEKRWNNLTVGNFNYKPAGWRVLVEGLLTIGATGSINDDGNSASGATGGTGLGPRGQLDAQAGAGATGITNSAVIVSNGNAGSSTTGASGAGSVYNPVDVLPTGGAGGNSTTRAGGAGGAAPHVGGGLAKINQSSPWAGRHPNGFLKGGGGGGSGALTNTVATLSVSGGGGSGGGGVCVVANQIINNGRISANGGNGANGSVTTPASNNVGGGGGGGGGWVMLTTNTRASLVGTVQANGGSAGAGAGTGGLSGNPGNAGSVMVFSFGGI